ncbi:54046371-9fb3-4f42-bba4-e6d8e1cd0c94 [Sclerotinia trifoliorum]|uniref:54046371-9fb3-4f42-bba4-e6d8e1cd0c94 n=1 Tax=Sclerotinia trifoliorum TaxID=28548 RepID=A0A8H2VTH2_9HELO|nr:54046371-9fb3-4f42-bba4-e6d8e1cd0c94 [Sclerotinia trifoliorum]
MLDGGGCLLKATTVSEGQAYLIESVLSCIMLILSFGTALDPRQAQLFGPRLGYPGAGLNPARRFSCAVARGNFAYQCLVAWSSNGSYNPKLGVPFCSAISYEK